MYLTYDEYAEMGGDLQDGAAWERLELRARKLIDRMTHGRIRDETPVRACVKAAMVELINAQQAEDAETAQTGGREIAGMSNDGVSVSYASAGETGATGRWNARKCAIVQDYLYGETDESGTALLYAGVDM